MTNLTTALAADEVWFNSRFHLESFLNALDRFLRKMPDHPPLERIAEIEGKSSVHSPGVEPFPARGPREAGPLRILWSSRWEHDKNPEDFFQALLMLKSKGVDFRLSILGESFRNSPKVFQEMKEEFKNRIDRWAFLESPEEYRRALMETDVYVSTANHEFFGIGAVEAMLAGNYPLLPPRLSYPELLEVTDPSDSSEFLYDGPPQSLSDSLARIDVKLREGTLWDEDAQGLHGRISRFEWPQLVGDMDKSLQKVCDKGK
ncbi:MAG: DUF3524 domain-containing protein [Candidatus Omnitrophica bacterium]|nr:DUF3524 domain-containing protein [Candidatus Omnitrophota bacterium]